MRMSNIGIQRAAAIVKKHVMSRRFVKKIVKYHFNLGSSPSFDKDDVYLRYLK